MTEQHTKIELKEVFKSFSNNDVLKGVNVSFKEGEAAAIIGESGSGKSVMLRIILGLLKQDKGTVLFDGESISIVRHKFLDKVGMLFQGGALFDSLPVWKNVAFKLLRGPHKLSSKEALIVAENKLERVGLGIETAKLFPAELSGGMMKRVGLARAIAHEPSYLLFDEPTTGLDPIKAANISQLIKEIVDEQMATALVITHDLSCVKTIADTIHFLHEGTITWSGTHDEMKKVDSGMLFQFVNGLPSKINDPT